MSVFPDIHWVLLMLLTDVLLPQTSSCFPEDLPCVDCKKRKKTKKKTREKKKKKKTEKDIHRLAEIE